MALHENISSLIGRIYEGVDDPARWETVLAELIVQLDAKFILQTVSDLRQRAISPTVFVGDGTRHLEQGMLDYADGLYRQDPSLDWILNHPGRRFFDTSEVFTPDQVEEIEFMRWNRNRCVGSVHWLLGYTTPKDDLTFGLSIHSHAEAGPLSTEKKALFKLLFEHMDRAIRLEARPPVFASREDALVLLDRNGCIREANDAARQLLDAADGLSVCNRQLQTSDRSRAHFLSAAIRSALGALRHGGFGGSVSLARPSGKKDLLLTVTPLPNPPSPFEAFKPAALVRIIDPETGVAPGAPLQWASMFEFTPAETRMAEALMSGDQNLRHAADHLGVTYGTARVHLKRLMEKTGTHSQSQLARLLSRIE